MIIITLAYWQIIRLFFKAIWWLLIEPALYIGHVTARSWPAVAQWAIGFAILVALGNIAGMLSSVTR